MLRIGIIGAMASEVEYLKGQMELDSIIEKAHLSFYVGNLKDKDVIVVQSGIGKVNAAICTQAMIDLFDVSCVINTGIAGGLHNEINIGDIVLSTDAIQHDMQVGEYNYPYGQIPGVDVLAFEADSNLLDLAYDACKRVNPDIDVYKGRVLTGDEFVSDLEKKLWLKEIFDGYCVEMEGAAIAHVAYLNKIPFLIIRAISDKADNSATVDFDEFAELAIKHSANLTEALLCLL